jgi:hypothetical protein
MPVKQKKIRLIGRREMVNFPLLNISGVEAKIDTGAYTSSIHCENIRLDYENSKPILYFTIAKGVDGLTDLETFRYDAFTQKTIKNSFGEMEDRFVIRTLIHIGRKKLWCSISLSNRDAMRYPVLIGRKLIKGKFLVDVNQLHTGGISLTKAFKKLTINNDL